ncbi:MAG TPA: alpha/beta hydrolase-fold protein [Pseudonocardia sp.]
MSAWGWVRDSSLLFGALPSAITVAGAVGMVVLLSRPARRWWLWRVPGALGFSVLVAGVLDICKPFPDPLPARVWVWLVVGVFAMALAAVQLDGPRRWRPLVAIPAAVLVILTAGVKINAVYHYRPTVAATLGLARADQVSLDTVPRRAPLATTTPDRALSDDWRPAPGMPSAGQVARVVIPSTVSGFSARPGWVYLPPAYLAAQRPLLPVLILVAGQPGWPSDWLTAGQLAEVMNRFAARHLGLAPVVVMPDATGSPMGNPLCFDSALGRVQTYLAVDVPAWVARHLQVNLDHRRWAIGGFSYGGTCSLQMAVNAPTVYPTFLDISGDVEPSLGSHRRTVAAAFAGNEAAFRAVNPLEVLARSQFPASSGRLVIGRGDTAAAIQAQQVIIAARQAKIDIQLSTVRGAHTWYTASAGLAGQLAWLAHHLGLVKPATPPRVRAVR